jgi:hypothetical protein
MTERPTTAWEIKIYTQLHIRIMLQELFQRRPLDAQKLVKTHLLNPLPIMNNLQRVKISNILPPLQPRSIIPRFCRTMTPKQNDAPCRRTHSNTLADEFLRQ